MAGRLKPIQLPADHIYQEPISQNKQEPKVNTADSLAGKWTPIRPNNLALPEVTHLPEPEQREPGAWTRRVLQFINIEVQIIVEQTTTDSPMKLHYGSLHYGDHLNFYQKPLFYTKVLSEAMEHILTTEPYRWLRQHLQFYPTNVRIEYENIYRRTTTVQPYKFTEEALKSNLRCHYAEEPELLTRKGDHPKATLILRLGLTLTIDQINLLQRHDTRENNEDPTPQPLLPHKTQGQIRFLETNIQNPRDLEEPQQLPSTGQVKKTQALPNLRTWEEFHFQRNEVLGIEAGLLLRTFIRKMDKVQREETDGDIRMRLYLQLVNTLMRKYAEVDDYCPEVRVTDNRTMIVQPRTGKNHPTKVFYLGEPVWDQKAFDKMFLKSDV